MTIQLSITIWTILCFIGLMLILHFLLFKPILAVMDKRKERIEKAKQLKQEREEVRNLKLQQDEEKKKQLLEQQERKMNEEIRVIQLNMKKSVEEAREERIKTVDLYRNRQKQEQEEMIKFLDEHTEEIVNAFANVLIKE